MVQITFLPIVEQWAHLMRSVFRSIGFGRQRASVESPYHNADDPTMKVTAITEAHLSVTSKPEQSPVVQPPPSKNTVNSSPNAKAAFNAFQSTLGVLGQTPIPGIGAVTAVLLQVVKGVQVRACSSRVFRYTSITTRRFYCILGNSSSRGRLEGASRTYGPSLILNAQIKCCPGITKWAGAILHPTQRVSTSTPVPLKYHF